MLGFLTVNKHKEIAQNLARKVLATYGALEGSEAYKNIDATPKNELIKIMGKSWINDEKAKIIYDPRRYRKYSILLRSFVMREEGIGSYLDDCKKGLYIQEDNPMFNESDLNVLYYNNPKWVNSYSEQVLQLKNAFKYDLYPRFNLQRLTLFLAEQTAAEYLWDGNKADKKKYYEMLFEIMNIIPEDK